MTWTFDKPAEVWKPKNEYLNLKVHIDEEKFSFFSKKIVFWSIFSCGLREFSSGTHANNSRQKSLFSCAQRPKKLKKIIIFPCKEVFLHGFPGHKKRCSDNSVSIFLLKSDFFCSKCKLSRQTYKFFKKSVSVQMFLWTRRMQLRYSGCYVFCPSQIFLLLKVQ